MPRTPQGSLTCTSPAPWPPSSCHRSTEHLCHPSCPTRDRGDSPRHTSTLDLPRGPCPPPALPARPSLPSAGAHELGTPPGLPLRAGSSKPALIYRPTSPGAASAGAVPTGSAHAATARAPLPPSRPDLRAMGGHQHIQGSTGAELVSLGSIQSAPEPLGSGSSSVGLRQCFEGQGR